MTGISRKLSLALFGGLLALGVPARAEIPDRTTTSSTTWRGVKDGKVGTFTRTQTATWRWQYSSVVAVYRRAYQRPRKAPVFRPGDLRGAA